MLLRLGILWIIAKVKGKRFDALDKPVGGHHEWSHTQQARLSGGGRGRVGMEGGVVGGDGKIGEEGGVGGAGERRGEVGERVGIDDVAMGKKGWGGGKFF